MIALILILASLVLFSGFLLVTFMEARRGTRVFASTRSMLDREIGRVHFIVEHVDLPGFVRDSLHAVVVRATHEFVRGVLVAVRFIERLLTRLVRMLREHSAVSASAAVTSAQVTRSPFLRAIRQVKAELRNGRIIHGVGH